MTKATRIGSTLPVVIRYARITLVSGETFTLRVQRDTAHVIRGIEVDRNGDEVVPPGGFHNRIRIVGKTNIKRTVEMYMNNTYGWLEKGSK